MDLIAGATNGQTFASTDPAADLADGIRYSAAAILCLVNDHAGNSWPVGPDPGPGEISWYLLRGVLGTGGLTYDTYGPSLVAGRDGPTPAPRFSSAGSSPGGAGCATCEAG